MRFWMVGCEKPKKSAPDGTMGATDLELRKKEFIIIFKSDTPNPRSQNQSSTINPSLCGELCYLTAAMAFSRLEWHVRAEEATMAF